MPVPKVHPGPGRVSTPGSSISPSYIREIPTLAGTGHSFLTINFSRLQFYSILTKMNFQYFIERSNGYILLEPEA